MPEPFKNLLNSAAITDMADHLAQAWPDFDTNGFIAAAARDLDALELKQRSAQITRALEQFMPSDFAEAVRILLESLDPDPDQPIGELDKGTSERGIRGWPVMAMADYVASRGHHNLTLSLDTLKQMTSRFSSEFAIRPFLRDHTEETLKTLALWTADANPHVRRLVSEGTRPRLPWGMQLKRFVADPAPVVELIERLKDDPSEYVRRSVANSLNDIAKDHPDLVAEIARSWLADAPKERKRLVRHALRSLVKAGHPGALEALGYRRAEVVLRRLAVLTPSVQVGDVLEFEVELASGSDAAQPLIIDYAVHHQRANGTLSPKVFKWKTVELAPGGVRQACTRHSFRPVTTRPYYPGRHRVELLVNGDAIGAADFELRDAD